MQAAAHATADRDRSVGGIPPQPLATQLVLFERAPHEGVASAARAFLAAGGDGWRAAMARGDPPRALRPPPGCAAFTALAHDIAALAEAYAARTGAPAVDVRLERVEDDACRAWHRDRTAMRLVTTYVGPGTVYVADADAEAALRLQEAYDGPRHHAPTGAVAWMRGTRAGAGAGLVHRSPRVEAHGLVRLFLAIDAAWEASPPPWRIGDASVWS